MIVTLTLNPSIDYILQVPELRTEDTMRAHYAYFQAGGKGINVSRVLTRLKIENVAWGYCGGDTGEWLRSFLDEEGVPHDFIDAETPTRINPIITEQSSHKQLRISGPGGRIQNQDEQLLLDRFKNLSPLIRWISLGGSLPPGIPATYITRLIQYARIQEIPCVLDADGEVLEEGLKGKPYLIKPNQYELSRLMGKPVNTLDDIVSAARKLIEQGQVEVVVTSQAEAGAVMVTHDTVIQGKAPSVAVMSKVGAGDSMVAGLLKGLMEDASLEDTLRMGLASGTAAVMTPGSELVQPHDYEALLSQVTVEARRYVEKN